MTRLEWGVQRSYKAGVEHGVAYLADGAVAWSGLIQVEEKPSKTTSSEVYLDGVKVLQTQGREDFYATLAAYSYPPAIEDETFGFSYRVGDEIHIVYGVTAQISERNWQTVSSKVDPSIFGFELSTVPSRHDGLTPTAHMIVDLSLAGANVIAELSDALYGTDISDPTLPTLSELIAIFEEFADYRVIDHGDGTWTAIAPDGVIQMVSPTEFQMEWPTAIYLDANTYTISTW